MKDQGEVIKALGIDFQQVGRQAWKSAELFPGRYATIRRSRKAGGFSAELHKTRGGQYKSKGSGATPSEALSALLETSAGFHAKNAQEHLDLLNAMKDVIRHSQSAPGDYPSAA